MPFLDASAFTHGHIQEFDPNFLAWEPRTGLSLILKAESSGMTGKVAVCPSIHDKNWIVFSVDENTIEQAVMLREFRVEVDVGSIYHDNGDRVGVLVEDKGKLCIVCMAPPPRPWRCLIPIADVPHGEDLRTVRFAFSSWRVVTDGQEGVVALLEVNDGKVV